MSAAQPRAAAPRDGSGRRGFVAMLAVDVVAPLVLYYALRVGGVGVWTALVVGSVIPLGRMAITAVIRRRVEQPALFTLVLLAVGTAVGVLTADPRLLMVRESYLTAITGGWIFLTLRSPQPLVMTATLGFLPAEAAASWRQAWQDSARFRRLMRGMTVGFGSAFLLDAAARVVMAYLLPLDFVPAASAVLLVVMLIGVVQAGKAYGRRHLQPVLDDGAVGA